MDNKNVFIAVALSMSVLLFWSAFIDPPKTIKNQNYVDYFAVEQLKKIRSRQNNLLSPKINM